MLYKYLCVRVREALGETREEKMNKPRSSKCVIFWLCLTFTMLMDLSVARKTRHYKWEVENMFWSPDCVENIVMGINGQYPGPTIRARAGDTLVIELTNKLHTEGVVIHWHGIRQIGSPWADGTSSISQCAINPGETFAYRFKVDKAGTYFYHGHYGMQRSAGLYGSLIVDVEEGEKEPFHYDGEFNLLLSDWWHESVHSQEVGLSSKPFRWIGEPQSLLINGRGQFNCSLAAHFGNSSSSLCKFRGNEQCAPQIIRVRPNKTYRLRLASTTSLASLNLAITNHKMTIVEADGNYIQPFQTSDIDIYSGETYSVLLTTNQNPNLNYYISINVRGRVPKTPPALTILNYTPTKSSIPPFHPPSIPPLWNNYTHSKSFSYKIKSLTFSRQNHPPQNHHRRRILLLNTQNLINGYIKWAINNVSLILPSTPYLGSIRYGLKHAFDASRPPPESFSPDYDVTKPSLNPNSSYGSGVYTLDFNTTIDVVLQNANALAPNVSEIHPWHLHGHDFWVLGYGEGRFSDEKGDELVQMMEAKKAAPPVRNTAVVFPYGWTMIRFVADNPGVWAFHCHIEPHLHMGMGVVFANGVDRVNTIPKNALGCGLTGKMLMNTKFPEP